MNIKDAANEALNLIATLPRPADAAPTLERLERLLQSIAMHAPADDAPRLEPGSRAAIAYPALPQAPDKLRAALTGMEQLCRQALYWTYRLPPTGPGNG